MKEEGGDNTYQKSTFGANFRFTKYSSLIAASWSAIAVSSSSSFPVLRSGFSRLGVTADENHYTLNTSSAVCLMMKDRGSEVLYTLQPTIKSHIWADCLQHSPVTKTREHFFASLHRFKESGNILRAVESCLEKWT